MKSHRAEVRSMLLDPSTPLAAALRECVALAEENGDTAFAAWADRELTGHPTGGPGPVYRRISAPIYGEALRHGSPVRQHLRVEDLAATHREEVTRHDAALALHQGVAVLEAALADGGEWRGRAAVLIPELPQSAELIRLMPPRADDLRFHTLYWAISAQTIEQVLAAIRQTAETRVRALKISTAAAAEDQVSTQTRWTKIGVIIGAAALVVTVIGVIVAIALG